MNLLLLLSALLSALTGAQATSRVPSAPVAVQAVAVAAATRVADAAVVGRPVVAPPRPTMARLGTTLATWRVAPAVPLYLSRRRE